MDEPSKAPRPPILAFAAFLIGLFVLLATWSISSPVGSSNDETFHLASMWCASDVDGTCNAPQFITRAPCFSERPSVTAICRLHTDLTVVTTMRYADGGALRNLYYKFGNFFMSADLDRSVLNMRLFNSVLATVMFGAVVFLGWSRLSRAFLVALCATLIPLTLFLVPSVNPESWQFIGAFSAWILVWLAFTERNTTRLIWIIGFTIIALSLMVVSRADGPLMAGIIVTSAAALSWFEKSLVKLRLYVIGGVVLVIAIWQFPHISGALQNSLLEFPHISGALQNSLVKKGSGFFSRYYTMHNLSRMLEFYFGDFATRIGDSDTGMPGQVVIGGLFIFVIWLVWGLRSVNKTPGIVSSLLLAVLIFAPVLVLNNAGYQIGGLFLPRYMWPIFFGFVFVLASGKRTSDTLLSWGEVVLIVGAFIPAEIAAQFVLVHRYTVGMKDTTWDLNGDKLWWWSAGPSPLLTVALGGFFSIVFIAGLLSLVMVSERREIATVA